MQKQRDFFEIAGGSDGGQREQAIRRQLTSNGGDARAWAALGVTQAANEALARAEQLEPEAADALALRRALAESGAVAS